MYPQSNSYNENDDDDAIMIFCNGQIEERNICAKFHLSSQLVRREIDYIIKHQQDHLNRKIPTL